MGYRKPLQLRLPADLKDWIESEAKRNNSSQNSEIVRSIRERMDALGHIHCELDEGFMVADTKRSIFIVDGQDVPMDELSEAAAVLGYTLKRIEQEDLTNG